METKKSFFKRRWVWIIVAIIIIILIVAFSGKDDAEFETLVVSYEDVTETVSATGQIRPKDSAALRFKLNGIVSQLLVDVGDGVSKGQVVARLNAQDLQKKLIQAEAEVNSALVSVRNAEQNLEDTKTRNSQDLVDVYLDAPVTLLEILNLTRKVNSTISSFYDTSDDILSSIEQSLPTQQLVNDADRAKPIADASLDGVVSVLDNFQANASADLVQSATSEIAQPLRSMQQALALLNNTIDLVRTDLSINAATLEVYRSSLATAQTNMTSALSKQTNLMNDLNNISVDNQLNINSAESDLRLKEAQLETARATESIAQQNVWDATLRSPINGTVAIKDVEIGELVTTVDQVYFIIGGGDIEITANIPEVDIGRVNEGGEVDTTLDALDITEHFPAIITSVDPDQTTIDGVIYYKTRMEFDEIDPRFKAGMSVNVDIILERKENVLAVPRRAINQKNGKSFIRVFKGDNLELEEREVIVGLRGDRLVEIIEGISLDEIVITGEE